MTSLTRQKKKKSKVKCRDTNGKIHKIKAREESTGSVRRMKHIEKILKRIRVK